MRLKSVTARTEKKLMKFVMWFSLAVAAILLLPFVSSDADRLQRMAGVHYTCRYQSHRDCAALFEHYRKNAHTVGLALQAGKSACAQKDATVCVEYGKLLEKIPRWPDATLAYAQACDLGNAPACLDNLILLTGGARMGEALARAEELCTKNVPHSCFLAGVIGRQMKDRTSVEWAFHYGCFRQETQESCEGLRTVAIGQSNASLARQAISKGCELGDQEACKRQKLLDASAALAANAAAKAPSALALSVCVREHANLRREFQAAAAMKRGSAKQQKAIATLRTKLVALQKRYALVDISQAERRRVHGLFGKELSYEILALSPNAISTASVSKVEAAHKTADAAYSRLPASVR